MLAEIKEGGGGKGDWGAKGAGGREACVRDLVRGREERGMWTLYVCVSMGNWQGGVGREREVWH